MEYEIVTRQETKIAGIAARTGNEKPDMQEVIGNLWKQFYETKIPQKIKEKRNDYAYGIYNAYEGDTYQVTVGVSVENFDQESLYDKVILPAGTYLKMQVIGDMVKDVAAAWTNIWQMKLNRTYTADFEEYIAFDGKNATVNIYVAIEDEKKA